MCNLLRCQPLSASGCAKNVLTAKAGCLADRLPERLFTEVNRAAGDVLAKRVTRGPVVRLGIKPYAIKGIGFHMRNNLPASDA
jgi:hypothetical protein